jgi:hypothetical protein
MHNALAADVLWMRGFMYGFVSAFVIVLVPVHVKSQFMMSSKNN